MRKDIDDRPVKLENLPGVRALVLPGLVWDQFKVYTFNSWSVNYKFAIGVSSLI